MEDSGQGSPEQRPSPARSRGSPSCTGTEGEEDDWGMGTLRTWGGTGIALDVRANVQAAHNPPSNTSPTSPARQLARGESIRFRRNESINRRELGRAESIKFFRGWGASSPRAEPSSPSGQVAIDTTFTIAENEASMESSYSAQMAWDSRDSSMISPIASTPMPLYPSLLQQAASSAAAGASKEAQINSQQGTSALRQLPHQISSPQRSPFDNGSEAAKEPPASRSRSETGQIPLPAFNPISTWQDTPGTRSMSAQPVQRPKLQQSSHASVEQLVITSLASPPPSSPPPSYDDALSCRSLGISPVASPQNIHRQAAARDSHNRAAASASDTHASSAQPAAARLLTTQSVPTTSPTKSHQPSVAEVQPDIGRGACIADDDCESSTHSAPLPLLKLCNSVPTVGDERHSAGAIIVGSHSMQANSCMNDSKDIAAEGSNASAAVVTAGTKTAAVQDLEHVHGVSTAGNITNTNGAALAAASVPARKLEEHAPPAAAQEDMGREFSLAAPADDVDAVANAAAAAWRQPRAPDTRSDASTMQQQQQQQGSEDGEQAQQAHAAGSSTGGHSDGSSDAAAGLRPAASRITISSSASSERSSSGLGERFRTGSIFRVTNPAPADLGNAASPAEEQEEVCAISFGGSDGQGPTSHAAAVQVQPAAGTSTDGAISAAIDAQTSEAAGMGAAQNDTQSSLPGPDDEDDVKSYVARLLRLEQADGSISNGVVTAGKEADAASVSADRSSTGSRAGRASNSSRAGRSSGDNRSERMPSKANSPGQQERARQGAADGQEDVKAYVAGLLSTMGDVPAVRATSKPPRSSSSNASRTSSSVKPSVVGTTQGTPTSLASMPQGTASGSSLSDAAAMADNASDRVSQGSTGAAAATADAASDRGSRGSKGAAAVAALFAELQQAAAQASQPDDVNALAGFCLGEDHGALQAAVAAALSQGNGLGLPSGVAHAEPRAAVVTGDPNNAPPSQGKQQAGQGIEVPAAGVAAVGLLAASNLAAAAARQVMPSGLQQGTPAVSADVGQQAPLGLSLSVGQALHEMGNVPRDVEPNPQQQQPQGAHAMQAPHGSLPAALAARAVSMPIPPALPGTPSDSGSSVASMQVHPAMHGNSMVGRPPGAPGAHLLPPGPHPPALRPHPAPPIPRYPGLLYIDGLDRQGRRVVVINAAAIPEKANQDAALKAVLAALQPVVAQPYVLVVVNVVMPSAAASAPGGGHSASATVAGATGTSTIDTLAAFWGVSAYKKLARPYRKNVKQVVLVAPSLWCRMMMTMAKPFVSRKADAKIKQISKLQELPEVTDGEVGLPALGFRFLRDARLLPPPRLASPQPGMHPHMQSSYSGHSMQGPRPMHIQQPVGMVGAAGPPQQQVGVPPYAPPQSPGGYSPASGAGMHHPPWAAGPPAPGLQPWPAGPPHQQAATTGMHMGLNMPLQAAAAAGPWPAGIPVQPPGVPVHQQLQQHVAAGPMPERHQLQQQGPSALMPGTGMGQRPMHMLPAGMTPGPGVQQQSGQQQAASGHGPQAVIRPGQLQGAPAGAALPSQPGPGGKSAVSPTYMGSQPARPETPH